MKANIDSQLLLACKTDGTLLLKSHCFTISTIFSIVFINACLGWLWHILMISWESLTYIFPGVSTEPTRRLLIWSFATFPKFWCNTSVDLSIRATPVIVSLSRSQDKNKEVTKMHGFHTNNVKNAVRLY